MSFIIDVLFVFCYYLCYFKIVKRLNAEFKILDEMEKTDLKKYKSQIVRCTFYLILAILSLVGFFLLNLMIISHYMDI